MLDQKKLTPKDRLDDHDKRLSVLEAQAPTPKGRIWPTTVGEWFQIVAAAVVICGALGSGTWYLGDLIVDRKIQPVQTDIAKMQGALGELKDRIGDLSREQVKIGLRDASKFATSDFASSLSSIRTALAAATKQKIQIAPTVLNALDQKFRNVSNGSPEYWPTVAEFITYRSTNLVSSAFADSIIGNKTLADCTDQPPPPMQVISVPDAYHYQAEVSTYVNCRVTLDSKKDTDAINDYLLHRVGFLNFKHCLVIYNGGPVNLLFYRPSGSGTDLIEGKKNIGHSSTKLSGKSVTFEECLFIFSIPDKPQTPDAQKMTESVLVQSHATVELPYPTSGQ